MKLIKLLLMVFTITSTMLLFGCGSTENNSAKNDYAGIWYAINEQGGIDKITLEKQGESYLVSYKKYFFQYPDIFDNGTYNKSNLTENLIPVRLATKNPIDKKAITIKNNILEVPYEDYKCTLTFKNNKLIGKPDEDYKEELIFEKHSVNESKTIYTKAKETFVKYISTREKYPLNKEDLKFTPNKYLKDEFKDYDKF